MKSEHMANLIGCCSDEYERLIDSEYMYAYCNFFKASLSLFYTFSH